MKKLMIAMSAATMAALYAQAAGSISGTNFESVNAENLGNLNVQLTDTNKQGDSGTAYWTSAAASKEEGTKGQVESQIVAGSEDAGNTTKFLKVDETEYLTRTMNGATAAPTDLADEAFTDDGVYIKTKVQFTAADDAPTVDGGDKLLVWLKQIEDDPETTDKVETGTVLMVTDKSGPIATDAVVNTTKWYDLEIRAKMTGEAGLEVLGFTVAIDGTEVNGGQVFQSIVPYSSTAATTIASIGFKGTGSVDDIEFGTFKEAVVETFSFSATVNDVYDETASQLPSFASATYSIDGGTPVSFEALSNLAVPTTAEKITLAVTVYDDAKLSNTGAVKDETPVKFDDGTAYVWTLDVDVKGTAKGAEKSVTLTIEKIGGGTPSINPAAGDDTISITADTKEAAEAAAIAAITAPDGVDVDAATYKGYFMATAVLQEDGTYTVTVELNPDVVTPAVVDDANLDIVAGDITINSKVGLWYSLVKGTTLSTIETVVDTKAGTGTVLTLDDTTAKGDAAFYKVSVTAVAPPAPVASVPPVEE